MIELNYDAIQGTPTLLLVDGKYMVVGRTATYHDDPTLISEFDDEDDIAFELSNIPMVDSNGEPNPLYVAAVNASQLRQQAEVEKALNVEVQYTDTHYRDVTKEEAQWLIDNGLVDNKTKLSPTWVETDPAFNFVDPDVPLASNSEIWRIRGDLWLCIHSVMKKKLTKEEALDFIENYGIRDRANLTGPWYKRLWKWIIQQP
jgi:hypothetical protein